jgi:hypothetical protein
MTQLFGSTATSDLGPKLIIRQDSEPQSQLERIDEVLRQAADVQKIGGLLHKLIKFGEDTGNYVQLLPQYKFLPVLVDVNEQPIPLYHFVEVLDEVVDYSKLQQEFPTLSFAQIDGAIAFLRKIAQFNSAEIDLDEFEDRDDTQDQELLNELGRALADQETSRVLHHD